MILKATENTRLKTLNERNCQHNFNQETNNYDLILGRKGKNIDLLWDSFRLSKSKYDYGIEAIVILPEHYRMNWYDNTWINFDENIELE